MYSLMHAEWPVMSRGGQVPNVNYAPAQPIGRHAARQLVITKEGEIQHGLDVTGRAYLGRTPPIVPKSPQLDDKEGRWPG